MKEHVEKGDVLYSCWWEKFPTSLEWLNFSFRFSIAIKKIKLFLLNRTRTSILPFCMRLRILIFTLIYEAPPATYTGGINKLYSEFMPFLNISLRIWTPFIHFHVLHILENYVFCSAFCSKRTSSTWIL